MVRKLAILVLLIAQPVSGQHGPSFDCNRAESSAEKLVCEDVELARLDRLVADRYAAALDVIRDLDSGVSEAEDQSRASQRGWIKGKEATYREPDPEGTTYECALRQQD
jgi:uncharacterized protein